MERSLTVLWATDGSPHCLSAVQAMRRFLVAATSALSALTVAPLHTSISLKMLTGRTPEERQADLLAASEVAGQSIDALGAMPFSVQRVTRWGDPAREILKEAENSDADIIVLGVKPRSTLRRVVFGDTAIGVLKATSRTVLLARPTEETTLRPVVILCHNQDAIPSLALSVLRLNLPPETPIYLTASDESLVPGPGMFFSYRELAMWKRDLASRSTEDSKETVLLETGEQFVRKGHTVQLITGKREVRQDIARLEEEISPTLLVLHAGETSPGALSSTLDIALHSSCSVLVVH